tara:strand:- start:9437 stop:9943 length:507 start_codon:yes stop_codon:yes gene_type:complete
MSIAGGLVPSSTGIPKGNLSDAYVPAGEGKWVVLNGGAKMAAEWKKGDEVPAGFAVINVEHGRDMTDMGPVPVTYGEWTLVIPRGSNRIVPLSHVNVLSDCITTEYFQKDMSSQLTGRHSRRFPFTVVKWPKTGEKEAQSIDSKQDMTITKETLEDAKERHEVIDLSD